MKSETTARNEVPGEGDWSDLNPGYGEKREYRKLTITIPQSAYQSLIHESARRKVAGEHNQLLSAILREAIADYLKKLHTQAIG